MGCGSRTLGEFAQAALSASHAGKQTEQGLGAIFPRLALALRIASQISGDDHGKSAPFNLHTRKVDFHLRLLSVLIEVAQNRDCDREHSNQHRLAVHIPSLLVRAATRNQTSCESCPVKALYPHVVKANPSVILERANLRGRSGIQRKMCRRLNIGSSTTLALDPRPSARLSPHSAEDDEVRGSRPFSQKK